MPGSPPPFAIDRPDRIPKQRYYDADFFELESEMLWSRVWQMACRLEEIPGEMDFVTYEILDQSVIVLRTEDGGARAGGGLRDGIVRCPWPCATTSTAPWRHTATQLVVVPRSMPTTVIILLFGGQVGAVPCYYYY